MRSLVLLLALRLAEPAGATPVLGDEQRWAEAAAREQAGDYAGAAELFAPLVEAYPQDYLTQLQGAWLAFLSQDYAAAEARYAAAIALSEGAPEARSGLAWTHLRQGQDRRARGEFEQLLAAHPQLESAQAGLDELRRRRFSSSPMAFAVGHLYAGHPTLTWAAGASVSVPMLIARRVVLTSTYRFARFLPEDGRGQGMMAGIGGGGTEGFDQHLAHVGAGMTWAKVGFLAQYAYLHDGSPARDHAHVAGLSLRYSPWGDGILDASAAAFESGWIGRGALSWRMPATRWLDLRPGFALQLRGREALPSGFASVIIHGRPGALILGGKGGVEERPVYLETPAIFAIPGRIHWGAWLGGDVRLGRGVHLLASYELHGLRVPDSTGALVPTQAHYLALGLSWRSAEAFESKT